MLYGLVFPFTKTFSLVNKMQGFIGASNVIDIECSFNLYNVGGHCNYSYKIIDRLMSEQLWPLNRPSLLADVEFLVSGVAFKAHRAILCARSPVFAAMFACGMSESETGRVEITDVSPGSFADFLKFVYTGQLDTQYFANSQLGYCADKYVLRRSVICANYHRQRRMLFFSSRH